MIEFDKPYKFGDNERPLEYHCDNGTIFKSDRLDMINGVEVYTGYKLSSESYHQALAEFIGWHSLHVHRYMNGFSGYCNIHFNYRFN